MTMLDETASGSPTPELTPAGFCRALLATLDAAEGRTRRRKRDQTPDRIGLGIKRDLLEAAVMADPAPDDFEGWLVEQVFAAPAPGAVRAMCEQVFLEYRMARLQPEMAAWLARGAPSDDARSPSSEGAESAWTGRDRQGDAVMPPSGEDRRRSPEATPPACTCDLPGC